MSTAETKASSASDTKGEESWSTGTDFDKLEKEASKIFALWELTESSPNAGPNGGAAPEPENWSAGDPSVSTLPDPQPVAATQPAPASPAVVVASPALTVASPPVVASPAKPRTFKKTMAGSAAPVAAAESAKVEPAVDAARPEVPAAAVETVQAAVVESAPVASAVTPTTPQNAEPLESIIIAPELREQTAVDAKPLPVRDQRDVAFTEPAPRASVAPDTVIDAKPLRVSAPPQVARAVPVAVEEPIPMPKTSSATVFVFAGVALVLAAVGGYVAFRQPAAPVAAVATVAPVTPVAAPIPDPIAVAAAPVPSAPVVVAPPAITEEAVVEPAAEAPVAEAVVEAPVAPAVVAPVAPPTHTVRLRVEPASATITVDGARVTLPYQSDFAEGSSHVIVASADGFEESTRTVTVRRDETVSLRLGRTRPAATRPAAPRIGSSIGRRGGAPGSRASSGSAGSSGGRASSGRGSIVTESPY